MKANEFVKKFGIEYAKTFLAEANNMILIGDQLEYVDDNELQRLVESFELVESYGGYEKAQAIIQRDMQPLLSAALADVESCQ